MFPTREEILAQVGTFVDYFGDYDLYAHHDSIIVGDYPLPVPHTWSEVGPSMQDKRRHGLDLCLKNRACLAFQKKICHEPAAFKVFLQSAVSTIAAAGESYKDLVLLTDHFISTYTNLFLLERTWGEAEFSDEEDFVFSSDKNGHAEFDFSTLFGLTSIGFSEDTTKLIRELIQKLDSSVRNIFCNGFILLADVLLDAYAIAHLPYPHNVQVVAGKIAKYVAQAALVHGGLIVKSIIELLRWYRNTLTNDRPVAEAAPDFDPEKSEKLLTSIVGYFTHVFTADGTDALLEKIRANKITQTARVLKASENLYDFFMRVWKFSMEIVHYYFDVYLPDWLQASNPTTELKKWMDETDQFVAYKLNDEIKRKTLKIEKHRAELLDAYYKGQQLLKVMNKDNSFFFGAFKNRLDLINNLVEGCGASLFKDKSRVAPVSLYIYGKPGTGKSTLLDDLFSNLFKILNIGEYRKERDVFLKAPTTQYYEGYAYQQIMLLDDVFQIKQAEAKYEYISTVINICHDVPCPLDCAHLDSKGAKFFHSPFVVMTSNTAVKDLQLSSYMSSPEALDRRIFLHIEPLPPAALLTNGKIDSAKIPATGLKLDDFEFHVHHGMNEAPRKIKFEELLQIVSTEYIQLRERKADQERNAKVDQAMIDRIRTAVRVDERLKAAHAEGDTGEAEGQWVDYFYDAFESLIPFHNHFAKTLNPIVRYKQHFSYFQHTKRRDRIREEYLKLPRVMQDSAIVQGYYAGRIELAAWTHNSSFHDAVSKFFSTTDAFNIFVEILKGCCLAERDKLREKADNLGLCCDDSDSDNESSGVTISSDFELNNEDYEDCPACSTDMPVSSAHECPHIRKARAMFDDDQVWLDAEFVAPTTWGELFKRFISHPMRIQLVYEFLNGFALGCAMKTLDLYNLFASLLPDVVDVIPFARPILTLLGCRSIIVRVVSCTKYVIGGLIEKYSKRETVIDNRARIQTDTWIKKGKELFDSHKHESQHMTHKHVCILCDGVFEHSHSLGVYSYSHCICVDCTSQISSTDEFKAIAESKVENHPAPKKKLRSTTHKFRKNVAESDEIEDPDESLTDYDFEMIAKLRKMIVAKKATPPIDFARAEQFTDSQVNDLFRPAACDPTAIDMVGSLVNNSGSIRCLSTGNSTSCLRIKGHIVMFPFHLIQTHEGEEYQFKFDSPTVNNVIFTRNRNEILSDPENDVALMKLPYDIPISKDVTKYFICEDSLKEYYQFAIMTRLTPNTGGRMTDNSILTGLTHIKSPFQYDVAQGYSLEIYKSFAYAGYTRKGDCGAPIVVVDSTSPRKIIGFHVAKSNGSVLTGYCNVMTQEVVIAMVNEFEKVNGKEIVAEANIQASFEDPRRIGDTSKGTQVADFYGFANLSVFGASKTDFVPSVIHGVFPVTTKPAMLKPGKVNGEWVDPLVVSSNRGNKVEQYYNDAEVLDAAEKATKLLNNNFAYPEYIEKRVLTDSEVLNGVQNPETGGNFDYLAKMELNTSLGYPLGAKYPSKKKKHFITTSENGERKMEAELAKMYHEAEEKLIAGECDLMLMIESLKDEVKPIEKAHKTRVFSVPSIVSVMLSRKYTLMYCAYLMFNHVDSEVACGINVHSSSWERLRKRLAKFAKLLAGDYIHWDKSLVYQMAIRFSKIMNDWYGLEKEEENKIRYILCCSAFSSLRQVRGRWLRQTGMPSGVSFTAVGNSIINSLIINAAFFHYCKKVQMTMDRALSIRCSEVEATFYGDDHVIALSEKAAGFLDMMKLKEFLIEAFGMNYTDTAKNEVLERFVDWENVTFLKRKWVIRDSFTAAPLPLSVLQQIPNWCSKSSDPIAFLEAALTSFCIELGHWDKQTYEENVEIVRKCLIKRKLPIQLLSFTEARDYVHSGLHRDMVFKKRFLVELLNELVEAESHHILSTTRDKFGLPTDVNWCPRYGAKNNEKHHKCPQCSRIALTLARVGDSGRACFECVNIIPGEEVPKWYFHDKSQCPLCDRGIPLIAHAEMEREKESENDLLTSRERPTTFEDVAIIEEQKVVDVQPDFPPFADNSLSLQNFFSRPMLFAEFEWVDDTLASVSSTDDTGGQVLHYPITYNMILIPQIQDKLRNIGFFRGNIKLELRINASQMHYGALQVSYMPYARAVAEQQQSNVASPYLNVVTQSYTNAQILSANQGESLFFDIGWPLNKEFIWIKDFESRDKARSIDLGALYICMLTPLCSASVETAKANVQVFIHLDDAQFGGFTTYSKLQNCNFSDLSWTLVWEKVDLNKYTFWNNIDADSVPTVTPILKGNSEGFSKTRRKVKYSTKNADTRKIDMDEFSTSAPKNYPKGSLTHDASLLPLGRAHTIAEIAGTYSLFRIVPVVLTDPPIFVTQTAVTPADFPVGDTANSVTSIYMTSDAAVASTCRFWKGDAVYKVMFVTSSFFSFRARLSWDPVEYDSTDFQLTGGNKLSKVVDVRGTSVFEFTVPYIRDTPYVTYGTKSLPWQTENGFFSVEIISAISHPFSSEDPNIYVIIWRKFENFELGRPCGDYLSCVDKRTCRNRYTPTGDEDHWCPVHRYGGGNNPNPPAPGVSEIEYVAARTTLDYNMFAATIFGMGFQVVKAKSGEGDDQFDHINVYIKDQTYDEYNNTVALAPGSNPNSLAMYFQIDVQEQVIYLVDEQTSKITTDIINLRAASLADPAWTLNEPGSFFEIRVYDTAGIPLKKVLPNKHVMDLVQCEGGYKPPKLSYEFWNDYFYVGGTPASPKDITIKLVFNGDPLLTTPDFYYVYSYIQARGINYVPFSGQNNSDDLVNATVHGYCYTTTTKVKDTAPVLNIYKSGIGNNFNPQLFYAGRQDGSSTYISIQGSEIVGPYPCRSWYKVSVWMAYPSPFTLEVTSSGTDPPIVVDKDEHLHNIIALHFQSVTSTTFYICSDYDHHSANHSFKFTLHATCGDAKDDCNFFYMFTIDLLPDLLQICNQIGSAEMFDDGLVMPESIDTIEELCGRFGQIALLPPAIFKQGKENIYPEAWLLDLESVNFTSLQVYSQLVGKVREWFTLVTRQSLPFRRYFMQMFRMVRGSTDILLLPSSQSYHNWQSCIVTNNFLGGALLSTPNLCGYENSQANGFATATPLLGGTPTCATTGIQFNQATNISGVAINVPYASNVRMIPTCFGRVSTTLLKNQLLIMNGDNDVSQSGMDDVAIRVFERIGDDFEFHMRVGMPRTYFDKALWGQNVYQLMARTTKDP